MCSLIFNSFPFVAMCHVNCLCKINLHSVVMSNGCSCKYIQLQKEKEKRKPLLFSENLSPFLPNGFEVTYWRESGHISFLMHCDKNKCHSHPIKHYDFTAPSNKNEWKMQQKLKNTVQFLSEKLPEILKCGLFSEGSLKCSFQSEILLPPCYIDGTYRSF